MVQIKWDKNSLAVSNTSLTWSNGVVALALRELISAYIKSHSKQYEESHILIVQAMYIGKILSPFRRIVTYGISCTALPWRWRHNNPSKRGLFTNRYCIISISCYKSPVLLPNVWLRYAKFQFCLTYCSSVRNTSVKKGSSPYNLPPRHTGGRLQLYSFFNLGAKCGWVVIASPRPVYLMVRHRILIIHKVRWATG